jgi:hypothetical protein
MLTVSNPYKTTGKITVSVLDLGVDKNSVFCAAGYAF